MFLPLLRPRLSSHHALNTHFEGNDGTFSLCCYGFSTSRWLTQPPRKKRWRTMSRPSRKMITANRTKKRNLTVPSHGEFRPAGPVMLEFGLI
jgi:hypothetical protein